MSQTLANSSGMGIIEELVWTAATGNEYERQDAGNALLGIGLVLCIIGVIVLTTN